MPALQLSSHAAVRRPSGSIVIAFPHDGRAEPLGRRVVAIRTAADARRAFDAYAAELRATGASARAEGDLLPGERAPRGFGALDLRAYVNLVASSEADAFTREGVAPSTADFEGPF